MCVSSFLFGIGLFVLLFVWLFVWVLDLEVLDMLSSLPFWSGGCLLPPTPPLFALRLGGTVGNARQRQARWRLHELQTAIHPFPFLDDSIRGEVGVEYIPTRWRRD